MKNSKIYYVERFAEGFLVQESMTASGDPEADKVVQHPAHNIFKTSKEAASFLEQRLEELSDREEPDQKPNGPHTD